MGIALETILSADSQALIKQYREYGGSDLPAGTTIDTLAVINWLNKEVTALPAAATKTAQQQMHFLCTSLQTSLLTDLSHAVEGSSALPAQEQVAKPKAGRFKFFALFATGTFLAACQGFDSIASIVGLFAVPAMATFLAGLAFSILSIVAFYGLNLLQIAKAHGVKLVDTSKWLGLHATQFNTIKTLTNKIMSCHSAKLSADEAVCLEQLLLMLRKRLDNLHRFGQQCHDEVNKSGMQITKNVVVSISGLLFFCGGFCSGQTVALCTLGLVFSGMGALSWPVLLVSVAVGLAAFALYWYVERTSSQAVISGWFGLDEELIDELSDDNTMTQEMEKVNQLQEQSSERNILLKRVVDLETRLQQSERGMSGREEASVEPMKSSEPVTARVETRANAMIGSNIHSFHRPKTKLTRSLSLSDLVVQDAQNKAVLSG